jgi:hypothetical protein
MSVDARARDAVRVAHDEVATIAVPVSGSVIARRRARRRARVALVGAAAIMIAAIGVGAGLLGSRDQTTVAVHPPVPRATLEFRPVLGVEHGSECVPPKVADAAGKNCFALGPPVLANPPVSSANAVLDPATNAWAIEVTFANDDFITKVARPLVNQEVAIVVNGSVQSAPRINPGISGREIAISGGFTEDQARRIAQELGRSGTSPTTSG